MIDKKLLKILLITCGIVGFSSCSLSLGDDTSLQDSSSSEYFSSEVSEEVSIVSSEETSSFYSSEEELSSEEEYSSIEEISFSSSASSSYVSSSGFTVSETGRYIDAESVAMYLTTYHKLPSNYIKKAQKDNYDNTYSIGGDYFGNKEGYLPSTYNGSYIECDIDATKSSRGAKRIVYETRTYRIFYTTDHYLNFREYYGYKSWSDLFGKSNDIY